MLSGSKEAQCLILLLRYLLTGKKSMVQEQAYNWNLIYKMSKRHHVNAMLYEAVKQLKITVPQDIEQLLKEDYHKAISRDIIFQFQYENIMEDFQQHNIAVIPLKGILIKNYYPASWMRSMSDIDLLARDEDCERIRDRMLEMGYTIYTYAIHVEDCYHMPPVVSIEIHRTLFDDGLAGFKEYFDKAEAECRDHQAGARKQTFSKEDSYLYMLAHMAKHFKNGGSGIRPVLDVWLYWKKEAQNMDLPTLDQGLVSLGLQTFHDAILRLGTYWMEEDREEPVLDKMTYHIIENGVYGTFANKQLSLISKGGDNSEITFGSILAKKIKAIRSIIFPGHEMLCAGYPKLKKYPFLLLFVQVWRLIKFLIFPKSRKKMTGIIEIKEDEVIAYRDIVEKLGISKIIELKDNVTKL